MQTDDSLERLDPEDLEALRRRFVGPDGHVSGGRADGAATLDDLAEALDVPPDEVRRQLDRIREERAVRPTPKRDQRPLLGLVVVLLGAAFYIHRLNPRPLTEEEWMAQAEERVAEGRAKRKAHPVVRYPIATQVKTGPMPPLGFNVTFRGALTDTTLTAAQGGAMRRDAAIAALTAAMVNGYEAARAAESAAPVPDKPFVRPNQNTGMVYPPGTISYEVSGGTAGTYGYLDPSTVASLPPSQRDDAIRFQIGNVAKGLVDSILKNQQDSLALKSMPGNYATLPPGFTIEFKGQGQMTLNSTPLVLIPIDVSKVALKLEYALRNLLWKDLEPPEYSTLQTRAAMAKRTAPPFADVVLRGPLSEIRFRLPISASSQYPTAADAARAADRILVENTRKAAAQVGSMTAGSVTR